MPNNPSEKPKVYEPTDSQMLTDSPGTNIPHNARQVINNTPNIPEIDPDDNYAFANVVEITRSSPEKIHQAIESGSLQTTS